MRVLLLCLMPLILRGQMSLAIVAGSTPAPTVPFANGYYYCKVVTTSSSMVSGSSDLTDYPLTVILTDADLKTVGNGGLVNDANGYDIGFYDDTTCSGAGTKMNWEMESYTASTGAIVAHLGIPTLSHTANTLVSMYYGGAYSTFQSTATAVWDANYKAVWHLRDGTTLSGAESTSAANTLTLTSSPGAVAGQVDGAASFNGTSSYATSASDPVLDSDTITMEAWANPGASSYTLMGRGLDGAGSGWNIEFVVIDGSFVRFGVITTSAGTTEIDADSTTVPAAGTWIHVAGVWTPGASVKLYINGVLETTTTTATTTLRSSTAPINMGRAATPFFGAGSIDEVRISDIARPVDWILTEYRNQSAPGTYLSVGGRITP